MWLQLSLPRNIDLYFPSIVQLVKDYQAWASGDTSRQPLGTGKIWDFRFEEAKLATAVFESANLLQFSSHMFTEYNSRPTFSCRSNPKLVLDLDLWGKVIWLFKLWFTCIFLLPKKARISISSCGWFRAVALMSSS